MTTKPEYVRPHVKELVKRLREPRNHIQFMEGARQVGKTTLARQALKQAGLPFHFADADLLGASDQPNWLGTQWERARAKARRSPNKGAVLVLDEVQKIPRWSSFVKHLWDGDTRYGTPLKVVLLGSAPLLLGRGLTESLAGRFERIYLPHWSFTEMRDCFGFTLEQYLFFGGYPGGAKYVNQPKRWADYVNKSLINTTITRDILQLVRIDKPALMRQLVELGCSYSGQILSFNKMLGQLQDAGNTTTLAHYLHLLKETGILAGLQKYAGSKVALRRSIPKLQVFNTALMNAQLRLSWKQIVGNGPLLGRLTESAVGAHLLNAAESGYFKLYYWREGNHEVDFVLHRGLTQVAIEVKSGIIPRGYAGLGAFSKKFGETKKLVVGKHGIPLEEFLEIPAAEWLDQFP